MTQQKTQLTTTQKNLIAQNKRLIGSFIKRYFSHEPAQVREELFAQGSLIICQKIGSYNSLLGKYSTWLYQVLSYCLRNYHNKIKQEELLYVDFEKKLDEEKTDAGIPKWSTEEEQDFSGKTSSCEHHIEISILREKIQLLSPLEQTVLMMYMSDYSPSEISERCNINQDSLYYIKDKAIAKLRRMYGGTKARKQFSLHRH